MTDPDTLEVSDSTGKLLKQWRKQRGMTQTALAACAEVSIRHLSYIERGKAQPGNSLLGRLVKVLGIPPHQARRLFNDAGYSHAPPTSPASEEAMESEWLLDHMLKLYEPFFAYVSDQYLNYVRGNMGFDKIRKLVPFTPCLFKGKTNALLTVAHPQGLRQYLENWPVTFIQMYWRLEQRAAAYPDDPLFDQLREELHKIPDVPELLKTHMAPETLNNDGLSELKIGEHTLRFTRVTSDFQGVLDDGDSTHYQVITNIPCDQQTLTLTTALLEEMENKDFQQKILDHLGIKPRQDLGETA